MRRAIEFETRLAYHDRILRTLPESMQAKEAYVIAHQAPSPAYEYEDPGMVAFTLLQFVVILTICPE